MREGLEGLARVALRYQELTEQLAQPEAINDIAAYTKLTKEHAELSEIHTAHEKLQRLEQELADARDMLAQETDAELLEMARQEENSLAEQLTACEEALIMMLVPKDLLDDQNVVLEVRGGTGGEEASLFAGDLCRMYTRYAEAHGWKVDTLSMTDTELGGVKEASFLIQGNAVYRRMKYESGVHRVQRIPTTESGGRIHTSAATVAVLPEAQEVELDINPTDLRIDLYRSGGAGGQHVNKTESAVRITHIPTGVVAQCQSERSQQQNREKAMMVLRSRLVEEERMRQESSYAEARRGQVGTGDRSERIRTYNFPQGRVTDHRINLTLYQIDSFMEGDCDAVIDALILADNMERRKQAQ